MAAKVRCLEIFVYLILLLGSLHSYEALANVHYHISDSNEMALSSDSQLMLAFAHHPQFRYRRQSGTEAESSLTAHTTKNLGADGEALSNELNQSVVTGPSTNGTNSSMYPATFTTAGMSTPKVPPTTAEVQNTEGLKDDLQNPFEDADIIHDHYEYYTSDVISNKLSEHWIDLPTAQKHETLSKGHRVAAVMNLKFDFYFYGHKVTNVTVATGGFIYMSPFLHQWLTATQYIAPLMANFDSSLSKDSSINQQSDENRFVVEWKNIILKDQNTTGKFHFQTILNKNGSIKFAYKSIPFPVSNISNEDHPVKVGVSDAYYNDTYIPEYNIKRRTIYEYHKVALPMSSVASGSVTVLTPLPTCNRLSNCDSCVRHVGVGFDCRWCNTIGRCSDGLDWYRQHWDREGCQISHVKDADVCQALPPPTKQYTDPLNQPVSVKGTCSNGKCSKKDEFPVAVVVVILLIICGLLAAMASWVIYAYKNPTSKSGMWLMEHRPSQIKARIKFWRSSSDAGMKYKPESHA